MKFYRAVKEGQNLYKPSIARGYNDLKPTGRGIYAFVVDGDDPIIRFWEFYDDNGSYTQYETQTLETLEKQFGVPAYLWREIEVDELDNVQLGYGRYANMKSDNWYDFVELPEAYIEFSEF